VYVKMWSIIDILGQTQRGKKKRCCSRSPRVLHDAAILLWKLFDIDEWKELLPNRARTITDDFHLGKRRGGQDGFEEPEDPRHDRGDVHEKLARLEQRIRVIELEDGAEAHARGTRDSVFEIGWKSWRLQLSSLRCGC